MAGILEARQHREAVIILVAAFFRIRDCSLCIDKASSGADLGLRSALLHGKSLIRRGIDNSETTKVDLLDLALLRVESTDIMHLKAVPSMAQIARLMSDVSFNDANRITGIVGHYAINRSGWHCD